MSVHAQIAVDQSLSKLPHMQTSSSWHGSFALLCSTAESYRAICHSTHEGEQTVCLNQFQVSYATTPTTYCKSTVSLSPALLHIHQFQQFVRVLSSAWLPCKIAQNIIMSHTLEHWNVPNMPDMNMCIIQSKEWDRWELQNYNVVWLLNEMCMEGSNTPLCEYLICVYLTVMCLFESFLPLRVKQKCLFINASHQHSEMRKTYVVLFFFLSLSHSFLLEIWEEKREFWS